MEKQWIQDWIDDIGKEIRLHGTTSTSRNLEVALDYSKCHTKYEDNKQAVLFVFHMDNWNGTCAFRMTDERFTAYPYEQEVLLMEGKAVIVLEVEDGLVIKNDIKTSEDEDDDIRRFNNKTISVIYCFAY